MSILRFSGFNSNDFKEQCLSSNTALFENGAKNWPAIEKWDLNYFEKTCPNIPVVTKVFSDSKIDVKNMSMGEYVKIIKEFKRKEGNDTDKVAPYCHDVPIFLLAKELLEDIGDFPKDVMPDWYAQDWSRFAQFFVSAKNSVTPLHFDTLLTHNLFFQIKGKKIFTIIRPEHEHLCYRKKWRWFSVDPENPDYDKYPNFKNVKVDKVEVNSGDIFYMPPGTIHHVRSLEDSISFNVDFHTFDSVLKSFFSAFKGMPKENHYYNYQSLKALLFKPNNDVLFNKYKSYLNYIS
ncbi:hypothetical protein CKO50_21870 [Pseudoalteromonas sp. HM-SA03]|uniref:cupin-like domain-containing protein n=1 Tax=Pseudoalteromonas sp. HM-SA03 TaxID=2029678 RepID=UPI000BAE28AC|nr:cupin-like domain-containing protein [Pseudoalteromonas sp. HM-SA03]PAX99277.1 hypothetical protein CKO50_21870 [Pseudoalteromonas sp. HM-SA03]